MRQTPDGFYRNIPEAKYHASEGVSKSDMAQILRSPAHWKSPDPPETEAMEFGSAMHPGILEPERFKREFVVYPASVLPGSGEGQRSRKKDFDDAVARNGQTVIKPEYMDQITAMRDAVMHHPLVKELKLLEDGEAELSAYFHDPEFDVLTKCRYDYLNPNNHRVTDLKSTTDAREQKFTNIAEDKKYGVQAGHYLYTATRLTKVEHKEFYFIAVERPKIKGQYVGTMVYQATEYLIIEGLRLRATALTIYKQCADKNEWPGYATELVPLDVPKWKKRKDMILD
jgi:exodeoxyribonuclease VIII